MYTILETATEHVSGTHVFNAGFLTLPEGHPHEQPVATPEEPPLLVHTPSAGLPEHAKHCPELVGLLAPPQPVR